MDGIHELIGQVCELDLIFNFQKAYAILDELIIAGELQESSKKAVLRIVSAHTQRPPGRHKGENGMLMVRWLSLTPSRRVSLSRLA
jgi:hypothetical protein